LEEMMDNKDLLAIIKTYKAWYDEGIEPTAKNFLYYEDQKMSAIVVSLTQTRDELSDQWFSKFEIKPITRENEYRLDIQSSLNYLKLRKVKRLINENQRDMEHAKTLDEQMIFLQTHQHLKQVEMELTKIIGTVIFK
jgi:DNA primase